LRRIISAEYFRVIDQEFNDFIYNSKLKMLYECHRVAISLSVIFSCFVFLIKNSHIVFYSPDSKDNKAVYSSFKNCKDFLLYTEEGKDKITSNQNPAFSLNFIHFELMDILVVIS
jgi:hypothetical protein